MAITSVTASTFIADTILLLRNDLNTNLTDPISRTGTEQFVMSSYPSRTVRYPIVTITDSNVSFGKKLGMQSEQHFALVEVEIRVWAKTIPQRDEISDEIINRLRTGEFGGFDSVSKGMFGFQLNSVVNISEDGEQGVKSKVMEVQYNVVLS